MNFNETQMKSTQGMEKNILKIKKFEFKIKHAGYNKVLRKKSYQFLNI